MLAEIAIDHGVYVFDCYEAGFDDNDECKSDRTERQKIIILGGGPNRIGQGIEFDYCCVHAAYALKDAGYETIMVNCNPETVSTDYDTSDRLYFEPLTAEDVIALEICAAEAGERHRCSAVIVQYRRADAAEASVNELTGGRRADPRHLRRTPSIMAEDRERFQKLLQTDRTCCQPYNGLARTVEEAEALATAEKIGFPGRAFVLPTSLAGAAMEIVESVRTGSAALHQSRRCGFPATTPVLLDRYLRGAIEIDVDCDLPTARRSISPA